MKTRIATMAAITLIAIQLTLAGEPAKKFATEDQTITFVTKNLMNGLRSTNIGLIESAMKMTAQMKMRYPAANVSSLVNVLNELVQNHPSGVTRYKAYIALSVCENPEWYANEETMVTANEENFFQNASNHMQEHLLSASSN